MGITLIEDDEEPTQEVIAGCDFFIRRISTSKSREIEAKARRQYAKSARAGDNEAAMSCAHAIEDAKLDYAIVNWKLVPKDKPCTTENKIKLPPDVKAGVMLKAYSIIPQDEGDDPKNSGSPCDSSTGSATASGTAAS